MVYNSKYRKMSKGINRKKQQEKNLRREGFECPGNWQFDVFVYIVHWLLISKHTSQSSLHIINNSWTTTVQTSVRTVTSSYYLYLQSTNSSSDCLKMVLPDQGFWRAGYLYTLPAACSAARQFWGELPLKQSQTKLPWQQRNVITDWAFRVKKQNTI